MFSIRLINNEKNAIYYCISYNYPDTIIPVSSELLRIIESKETQRAVSSTHPLDEFFSGRFSSDTLLIFYFNTDTINKYTWNEIRDEHKIIRKNLYSKQDLIDSNWTITYP
jgi:hypothetical protein